MTLEIAFHAPTSKKINTGRKKPIGGLLVGNSAAPLGLTGAEPPANGKPEVS